MAIKIRDVTVVDDSQQMTNLTGADRTSSDAVLSQYFSSGLTALHRSPNTVSAMFVYDTSKDSDGGAWTRKCSHTSWYNETLSGRWLAGGKLNETDARLTAAALGPELLSNGDFSSTDVSAWVKRHPGSAAALTVVNNELKFDSFGGYPRYNRSIKTTPGKLYKLTISFRTVSTNASPRMYVTEDDTLHNPVTLVDVSPGFVGPGTNQSFCATFVATKSTHYFWIGDDMTTNITVYFRSISIKEVLSINSMANDYYQSTSNGAFYALSKNLLTSTSSLSTQTQWLTAGTYTFSSATASSGSVAIAFGSFTIATHTAGGAATTFTIATSGSVTFTVTGSVTVAQCEAGSSATTYLANGTTRVYSVTRGNKRDFPKVAAVVTEQLGANRVGRMVVYDLTEQGNPMWMVFSENTGIMFVPGSYTIPYDVCCLNASFYIGSGAYTGLIRVNFINEYVSVYAYDARYAYKYNLSNRNSSAADRYYVTDPTLSDLGERTAAYVSATVLPNTPINVITGLPTPTVAVVGSIQGLTVHHADGSIGKFSGSFGKPVITPKILMVAGANGTWYYTTKVAETKTRPFTMTSATASTLPEFSRNSYGILARPTDRSVATYRASSTSIQALKHNEAAPARSVVSYIATTYNTGYMTGDIRRSYLTSVAPGTVTSTAYAARGLFLDGTTKGIWLDPSDLGTMYQYSTGSTPVTAVEQQVGLILDKSNGLQLGSELTTNGNFNNGTTGWSYTVAGTSTASISNGVATITKGDSYAYITQNLLTAGKVYSVTLDIISITGTAVVVNNSAIAYATFTTTGTKKFIFRHTDTATSIFYLGANSGTVVFDNVSVKEVLGNHAYVPDAARPTLSARYNLLTKTENLNDNSVWTPYNSSLSGNTSETTDPLSGTSATKVTYAGAASSFYVDMPAATYSRVYSIYAKKGTYSTFSISIWYTTPNCSAGFDLNSGIVTGTSNCTATIEPTGNGWYRCKVEFNVTGTYRIINYVGNTSGDNLYLFGASLVPADQAGLPYQRVNTATDYDSDITKFPYYLKFSGAQYLQTNSIDFSYTDKMFVSAGVRKLSLSGVQAIFELGQGVTGVSGTFNHFASASTSKCNFGLTGATGTASGFDLSGTDSIATFVTSCRFDLSGASRDSEIFPKVNGVTPFLTGTNDTTAGTGNFNNNYSLYIGARAGNQYFFNGQLSQLLIAGKAVTTKQIQDAENYIEQKTYGTYPEFLVDASGNQIVDASGNPLYANVTYQY